MSRILLMTTLCCLFMTPALAKERLKGVKLRHLERALKKDEEKEEEKEEEWQTSSPTSFSTSFPTSFPTSAPSAVPEEDLSTLELACLAAAEDKVFATESSQDIAFQFEVLTSNEYEPSDVANAVNGGLQSFLISQLVEPNCVTRRLRDLSADAIRGVSVVAQDDGSNQKSCSQLQTQADNQVCYAMSSLAKIYYEEGATIDESEVTQKTNALLEIKFDSNSDATQFVLDTAYGSNDISPVQDSDRNAGNQGTGDDSMGPAGIFFLTLLCVCIVAGSALFVVRRRRRRRQSKEKEDGQENDGDDSTTLANVLSEEDAHTSGSGSALAHVVTEDNSFLSESTREVLKTDTMFQDLSSKENIIPEEPDFLEVEAADEEEGMECGYDEEKSLDESLLPPPPPPPVEDHPAYKSKVDFPTDKDNVDLDFHAIGDSVDVSFTSTVVDDDAEQVEVSFSSM